VEKTEIAEKNYIQLCMTMVEKKLGWPDSNTWRHRDFVKLSDIISEKTKIQVSVTTLKRLWGKVSYEGNVGPNTLDALSIFTGYEDWMDFKSNNPVNLQHIPDLAPVIKRHFGSPARILAIAGGIAILAGSIFWLTKLLPKIETISRVLNVNEKDFIFESENPKGPVPFAVKFNFDISKIDADSFFIRAGDSFKKFPVTKKNNFLTRIYFIPGPKYALLIANDQELKKIPLFAYTNGWIALVSAINPNLPKDIIHPRYITGDSLISNNRLYVSPQELAKNQLSVLSNPFHVNYFNVKHFNVDGNNFALRTRIKNNVREGGDVCQKSNVSIMCNEGYITIPMINPGCIALAKVYIGDIYINGWTTDLSAFAKDMNQWHELYIRIKDKNTKIFIDGQPVIERTFTNNMGEILGFRFEFQGCGSIDYVKLYDHHEQLVYEDDFGGAAN